MEKRIHISKANVVSLSPKMAFLSNKDDTAPCGDHIELQMTDVDARSTEQLVENDKLADAYYR